MITVTAKDGVGLATEVMRPTGGEPAPVVLVRTPYGRRNRAEAARPWVEAGMAVVVQDLRGRGGSGGAFIEGDDECADGDAAVAWVASQPWCDGRVVCMGLGYEVGPAWQAAASGHPAIAAVVARQPWTAPEPSGPFPLEDLLRWHSDHLGGDSQAGVLGRLAATLRPQLLAGALADLGQRWPVPLGPWPPARPAGEADHTGDVAAVAAAGVPSLHLASWFCASAATSLAQAAAAGASATTVAGPWVCELTHRLAPFCALSIDPAAVHDPDQLAAAWVDRALGGRPPGPRSRTFLLGSHRWTDIDPLSEGAGQETSRWQGAEGGALVASDCASPAAPAPLRHDPDDPYPSGRHSDEHRPFTARADLLAWSTGPLTAAVGWLGRARCRLVVDASKSGCDLVATLLHERPGGSRTRLVDAAVEVPTGHNVVEIAFPPAAVELPADHALRIEITGSRFPRFARSLPGSDRWNGHTADPVILGVAPSPEALLILPSVAWPPDPGPGPSQAGEGLDGAADLGLEGPLARLVDERTGVVTSVRRVPTAAGSPPWLHLYAGAVADIGAHLPWPADRVSTGMSVGDRARARVCAVGEAVERYCGNFVPAGLVRDSFEGLATRGAEAVDPRALALYSPAQYAEPGFPFRPFTADLVVRWAEGRWLDDARPVLVPASLVYVNYYQGEREAEPVTNFVNLAAIAAGASLMDAETSAMEELIERDATMIWWLNGLPARPIHVEHPRLAPLLDACPDLGPGWARARGVDSGWRYRLVSIPTTLDVAVVGVLVHDPDRQIVGLGVAARPNPADAIHKAFAEAVSLHIYASGLLDPDGAIWQLADDGLFDGSVLKAHRADRRYRHDYRPDWHDALDLACHSQVWLDPSMADALAPIVGPAPPVALDALPRVTGDVWAGYRRRLLDRGLRPCSVDLTTPDVAATGTSVVRVVAPGAYSNPPAAFPFLGGRRLYDDPVTLGLRPVPIAEPDLVLVPLPHT